MSSFKVMITPTRVANQKQRDEAKEPSLVILAPFTPKSTVTFDDIPVTKTAKRFLRIFNPSNDEIKILLTKILKPEFNAKFEWTSNLIGPESEVSLEIEWTPMKIFKTMETIQFTDSRGIKKDVSIVLKSIMIKNKKVIKRPLVKSKFKTPSPIKQVKRKISPVGIRRRSYSSTSIQTRKLRMSETTVVQKQKSESIFDCLNIDLEENTHNKENKSPKTPRNASSLFDNLHFTPATETKTKSTSKLEHLASCNTPATLPRHYENVLRASNFELKARKLLSSPDSLELCSNSEFQTPTSMLNQNSNSNYFTPTLNYISLSEKIFEPEICSTVSRQKTIITDTAVTIESNYTEEFVNIITSNKTFEDGLKNFDLTPKEGNVSVERLSSETYVKSPLQHNLTINATMSQSPQLSIIAEEEQNTSTCVARNLAVTFNFSNPTTTENNMFTSPLIKSDENIILPSTPLLSGTPLRKIISLHNLNREKEIENNNSLLKHRQGSMPNLDDDFKDLKVFEHNRFFRRSPSQSELKRNLSTNILFYESEICAQSSSFNINEIDRPSNNNVNKNRVPTEHNFNRPVRMSITPPSKPLPSDEFIRSTKQSDCKTKKIKNIKHFQTLKLCNTKLNVSKSASTLNVSTAESSASSSIYCTPRKVRRIYRDEIAEPIPLFDQDMLWQNVINPDPFAATTTCDPFLSATMYLDQKSVERHETQFKKWLNALVTVPEDIEINKKIDLGKLFQDVRSKELQLAPSKETVSSKYFTKYRMISLRKTAFELFQSMELKLPLSKLVTLIEKQQLSIRSDRNLHLDLVLQRNILELLLSFNPLWLRIGLEVVFNQQIPLASNFDIYGLSSFILNHLFRDRNLESKSTKSYCLSPEYGRQIKLFALKQILVLLLFLDKAKEKKIIKHNPCLFVKNSQYKETKEVLIYFSSSLVANIGDITKYLKRIGYILTHKQSYLDEFNYAFNNLAVDLRDGVRLTRVMEIILLRDGLSTGLRTPAISRLQKIHNVEIALKALAEADFQILGDINSRDIVDGHREKTLSLLWQIIYKFRAPKFNAAATTIQRWWKNSLIKVFIRRRIKAKHELQRKNAATKIQATFRGYLCRKKTTAVIVKKKHAILTLQTHIRCFLIKRRYTLIKQSTIKIQSWYRNQLLIKQDRNQFILIKKTSITIQRWYRRILLSRKLMQAATLIKQIKIENKLKYEKAVLIQKVMKSYIIRKKFRRIVFEIVQYQRIKVQQNNAATKIQSYYKMWVCSRKYQKLKRSTLIIQTKWRSIKARKCFIKLQSSAIVIQNYIRNYLCAKKVHREYILLKKYTIIIQQRFVANLKMKKDREMFCRLRKSVVNIQQRYRSITQMRIERQEYLLLRKNTLVIQRRFRGLLMMREDRKSYIMIRRSVIVIQKYYRRYLNMKTERNIFIVKKQAAVKIQSYLKGYIQRKKYLNLRKKTIIVQQVFRAKLQMRFERKQYLQIKNSAIVLQQRFRANKLMRSHSDEYIRIRKAVITIQQRYRANIQMRQQRNLFIALKSSTIRLQIFYRSLITMRTERNRFLLIKKSVISIQKFYRGFILMKTQRNEYLRKKSAAIAIQSCYRRYIARKHYLKQRTSIIRIQNQLRATLQMKEQQKLYSLQRKSILIIQQRYRAQILMKTIRGDYLRKRNAACTIQNRFRAQFKMRIAKTNFTELRKATIFMQNTYRNLVLMRKQRQNYILLKSNVIKIQKYYRNYLLMKKYRIEYQQKKLSIIKIQTWFRGVKERRNYLKIIRSTKLIQTRLRSTLLMKKHTSEYLLLRKTVLFIQNKFKANRQMKLEQTKYELLRKATITIQTHYRATMLMKKQKQQYLMTKSAVMCIQSHFRAKILMKTERIKYIKLQQSVIKIQKYFRGYLLMKNEKKSFITKIKSAIKIQVTYRGYLQRMKYKKLKSSTLLIQQKFRAIIKMRKTRTEYLRLRRSVIQIQNRYRSTKLMRLCRTEYISLRSATITIQTRYRCFVQMKHDQYQYQSIKSSAITIQRKYRALIVMRAQKQNYTVIRRSAITIQTYFRNYLVMKQVKNDYLKQKSATVKIQSWYKGILERGKYLKLKNSTIIIQRKLRATLEMKKCRQEYVLMRNSTIKLQRYFRQRSLMVKERNAYLLLKHATVIIQNCYRAQRQMKLVRNQYLLIRSLVIYIQRKYRAHRMMIIDRVNFLNIQYAVIFIQRMYRSRALMLREREHYLQTRNLTIQLQARIRGYIARKNYEKLWQEKMSPEAIERRKQQKAAIMIQCNWRGYRVRKSLLLKQSKKIKPKKLFSNTDSKERVGFKLGCGIKYLKGRYSIAGAYNVLVRLENITRIVPYILIEDDCDFIASFCYNLMSMAIRSEPDKQIIELCSKIMLNLARFEPTTHIVFQSNGLVTIAQMLLRWCDKEGGIFNTLCTLIWVFSHQETKKKKIREFMTTPDAFYTLRETKKLVIRKENMKKNYKKTTFCSNRSLTNNLPTLKPDFGVAKQKSYVFENPVFGFETILEKLSINL